MKLFQTLFVTTIYLLMPLHCEATSSEKSDWFVLDRALQAVEKFIPSGMEAIVVDHGKEVHHAHFGAWVPNQSVELASASKWFTAATIMAVVDQHKLSLDDKVSRYLPYFVDEKANITLRQLLSHTAGFSGQFPCLYDSNDDLDNCVRTIARTPLKFAAGSTFYYSDAGMQVAGRMAEIAMGKQWREIFKTFIVTPLALENTVYGYSKDSRHFSLASGVHSSANDYAKLLLMYDQLGVFEGKCVLSSSSVKAILQPQTRDARMDFRMFMNYARWSFASLGSQYRYGLGNWVSTSQVADEPVNHSRGYWGFTPLLLPESHLLIILARHDDQWLPLELDLLLHLAQLSDKKFASLSTNIDKQPVQPVAPNLEEEARLGLDYVLIVGGLARSKEDARNWFTKAWENSKTKEHPDFMLTYTQGPGVSEQELKMTRTIIGNANRGNNKAHYQLALALDVGSGGLILYTKKALEHFRFASRFGNGVASVRIGDAYVSGLGLGGEDFHDEKKAITWYQTGVAQDTMEAELALAITYIAGMKGFPANITKAIYWFKHAASRGSNLAQYNLGAIYNKAIGVAYNAQQAAEWFRQSADTGGASSQLNLSYLYAAGHGVTKDLERSYYWYNRALVSIQQYLQINNALLQYDINREPVPNEDDSMSKYKDIYSMLSDLGQYRLGLAYLNGKQGINQDIKQGIKLVKASASAGNSLAQYELAKMYQQGIVIPINQKEAQLWYKKAATQGHDEAQFELAVIYLSERKRQSEAAQWLFASATQGNKQALAKLSAIKNDYNISVEIRKKIESYEIQILKNEHLSIQLEELPLGVKLVQSYEHKSDLVSHSSPLLEGIRLMREHREDEAIQQFTTTALQGDASAELALCLLNKVQAASPINALKWCKSSAEHGNPEAQYLVGEHYLKGVGVEQNEKEALKWFQAAANQDNAAAQLALSREYIKGTILPWDIVTSYMWANLSAAHDNKTAVIERYQLALRMNMQQIEQGQKNAYDWYEQFLTRSH